MFTLENSSHFRKEEGYCQICFNADNDADFSVGAMLTDAAAKAVVKVRHYKRTRSYLENALIMSACLREAFVVHTDLPGKTRALLDPKIAL